MQNRRIFISGVSFSRLTQVVGLSVVFCEFLSYYPVIVKSSCLRPWNVAIGLVLAW